MSTQYTLELEATDDERQRPGTMLWCPACDDWVLRSERYDHPHDVGPFEEFVSPDDEREEADDPERVGAIYEITLSYSVDYRFRVPAYSEHEAEERAKDLRLDARPTDSMLVHTRDREVSTIMSDDERIDSDWDPYGGTPLWEVFES